MARTYLCIDLKSFYASVECVERGLDPLTTNLVVADTSRSEKTICLAVTPSLKARGIPGRARLFEVNQKISDIERINGEKITYITAPPRMQLYIDYSANIYSIYLKYVSKEDIHVYSIDEVFIDATQYLPLYHMDSSAFVSMMIQDVQHTTGITATAGIGTNLYLAKVALDIVAKHAQPDAAGVRMAFLDEDIYKQLLWEHTPLTDFWGIGNGISKKLAANGMHTMGDIAQMSLCAEDLFYKLFGVNAELLIDHAWGVESCTLADIKSYRSSSTSVSSGQVLPCNYPYEKARMIVQEMIDALVLELIDQGMSTDAVVLDIGYDHHAAGSERKADRYGRMCPKPAHGTARLELPTSSAKKIMAAALELFDRIADRELDIRRITVTFLHICPDCYQQVDLFTDTTRQIQEKDMQRTILHIKKRFGKNAIFKGTSLKDGATARERNNQIGGHKK